jgi:hypothetical protein
LLLSVANYSIGDGKNCWRELGTAILLALEIGLNRENSVITSPLQRELDRRTFWACFALDRFLACGPARPMLIRDEDIYLRLPCPDENFQAGLPNETPFFSPTTFQSSTSTLGHTSADAAFIGILSILGRATSYLQTGGVKGDTHFPWHPNSKLATLRSELAVWWSSVAQQHQVLEFISFDEPPQRTLFFAIQIYHLVQCLLCREFLPIDYQLEITSVQSPGNWQAETIEQCLSHADEIASSLQSLQSDVVSFPPFMG